MTALSNSPRSPERSGKGLWSLRVSPQDARALVERFGPLEVVGRKEAFDSARRGTTWRSQAMCRKFFARRCKEQKQLPRRRCTIWRLYEELRRYRIWGLSVPSSLSGNMEAIVTVMGARAFPAGQAVWWKVGPEDHPGPAGSDVHGTRNCRPSVRVMVTRNSNRSVSLNRVLLEPVMSLYVRVICGGFHENSRVTFCDRDRMARKV